MGWKLCFLGVLFPLVVGLGAYFTGFIYSILLSPTSNWSFLPFIQFNFTFSDLLSQDKELAAVFLSTVEVAWSNVHNAAALGLCVIYFGLRQRKRWAWIVMAYLFTWSTINDSITAWHLYQLTGRFVPMPFIGKGIFMIGLWLSRDVLFRNTVNQNTDELKS